MQVSGVTNTYYSSQNQINFMAKPIHPRKRLDDFSSIILKRVSKNQNVDADRFADELHVIGEKFNTPEQKTLLTKGAKRLAEGLVDTKNGNLAGIVYSFLIKVNKGNNKVVEELATNALAIAKRVDDPIHVMARANDLKEVYKYTEPRSPRRIKIMYEEKRALVRIVNDYDRLSQRTSTRRGLKPKEGYAEKLAAVKMEIGQALFEKDNQLARKELQEALDMYKILGEGKNSEKIQKLLEKQIS